ncbi:MAG TPA: chemotaxis protein CheB [Pirellulaceae bacterium]|jgi:two-component system chemotaxis response regulator CheB|nr:chemotaxis protein CheB [Pirellulaceae bacterium]
MSNRDVVVVGASSGGRAAIKELVAGLPADFPGAMLVVVHSALTSDDCFPRLLSDAGPLPAAHANDGEPVLPGRIYCARPDRHLVVREGLLRLTKGPKENRFRPAVDPLFRSAARAFGSRVVGAVLSGRLDDGSRGMAMIKSRGGIAIVQSPEEASSPEMPESVLRTCAVDFTLPVREMSKILTDLATGSIDLPQSAAFDREARDPAPDEWTEIAAFGDLAFSKNEDLGKPSGFTCPDCGGALFERGGTLTPWMRCHVGHTYTPAGLLAAQEEEVESALWTALRTLEEAVGFRKQMTKRMVERGLKTLSEQLAREVGEYEQQAASLRRLLLGDGQADGSRGGSQ